MFEATLRYSSNSEKQAVETSGDVLDSLIIPGKMLAANSKALPNNLRNYSDKYGLDYYIQPTLYDFRVGANFREDGSIRSWHQKYIDEIGETLETILKRERNVNVANLSEANVRKLTEKSVEFQENFVPNKLADEADRYDPVDNLDQYRPEALIPWFQRINLSGDIDHNDQILRYAVDAATMPLKPCLFFTQSAIRSDPRRTEVLEMVSRHNIDQCFLWVEDLHKKDTTQSMYKEIASFVVELSENGIEPHFFYGDYFATMLSHLGATGTTYGVMYGEEGEEKREPRSGDGVIGRYYVDGVKDFLKVVAAVDVQQRVGADVCSCDVCSRQLETWSDLTDRDQDDDKNVQAILKKHHLNVRWRQIRSVEEESLDETLKSVERDFEKYNQAFRTSRQVADGKSLDYLHRWKGAIESVRSD